MAEDDLTIFDEILDQLARGETYAARDEDGSYHGEQQKTVMDAAGGESDPSHLSLAPRRQASSSTFDLSGGSAVAGGGGRQRLRLMLPRPSAVIRVFSLAVVVMMAGMTALAAIIAQSVEDLTAEVRSDERYNREADIHDQPISSDQLIDTEAFAGLLQRWPKRTQRLLLKRFHALAEAGAHAEAIATFERAQAYDNATIASGERLAFARELIADRQFERAMRLLEELPAAALDEAERLRQQGMITRLQLALDDW